MKKLAIVCTLCFVAFAMQAQSIGEYKPSLYKFGLKKVNKVPKRVYIQNFAVHFEVYKEAVDYKQGGSGLGSAVRSDAKATAAVGIGGVMAEDMQAKTNELYNEFVAMLKAEGLEIISVDEAARTEAYEDWVRADGPYVAESGMPGVLVSAPDGYSFMYRGLKKNGKKKKALLGESFKTNDLSKDLGGAIIADVNLYVMFTEDKQDLFKGNAAKVKILTNLRMVGDYYVSAPKTKGLRFKGAQTVEAIKSGVTFTFNAGKGVTGVYQGSLKKPIEINGVMKREKIVAYQKQGSVTPTSFTGYSYTDLADRFSKTAKWIEVDSKKYSDGVYNAATKFVTDHTKAFLSNY